MKSMMWLKGILPCLGRAQCGEVVDCQAEVSKRGEDGGRVLTEPFIACPFELEIRPVLRSFEGPWFRMKPSGRHKVGDISPECALDD